MKRLFVEPIDVLMFRTERPFIARETHIAKTGVISPLTFEGAIKSKIFNEFCKRKNYSPNDFQRSKKRSKAPEDLDTSEGKLIEFVKQQIEKDKELKEMLEIIGYSPMKFQSKLNVLGVFFAKKNEGFTEYFPVPNDIVRKDNKDNTVMKLQPKEGSKSFMFEWMNEKLHIGMAKYSQVENIDGLIDFNDLKTYLNGGIPSPENIKPNPYFKEIRPGIGLEKSKKKTIEGALYTAEFLRIAENWGFVVWIDCPANFSLQGGLIRLGGEGKGAILQTIKDIRMDWSDLIQRINEDKKFKLYLAAPSYFNGCIPPRDRLEKVLGVQLKLVAAFPGKPIYIGGYDLALNKEKSLKRWVNAGAVYYYRFEGEIKKDLLIPIKIIDESLDMRCAFIGRW